MDVKSLLILNCFCLLILFVNSSVERTNYFGFCADAQCSVPVSRGIAIIRYLSPEDSKISVEPNDEVEIYVKEYGPKKDLWGVVVRGNRGYISKNFIREKTLLQKRLVPAVLEFKTSIVATDSIAVSTHLNIPNLQSSSLTSDAVPVSHSNPQATQQDFVSSSPGGFNQEQNSFSENLHSSQLNPNINPGYSESHQASQYNPSFNPSSEFSENVHASQFNPNLNPGYSENVHASQINPNWNPGISENVHASQINPNWNPRISENVHASQINPNFNPGSSENFHASHLNPNFNPGASENLHSPPFNPSLNPSSGSGGPHMPQLDPSLYPSSDFSQNLHASHLNGNNDIQSDSRFQQSGQHNVPLQSSQFHSGHVSSSAQFSGQQFDILPSPTAVPNVMHASSYESLSDDEFLRIKLLEDSLVNGPGFEQENLLNFPHGPNHNPNSVWPGQGFKNVQQQQQQLGQQQQHPFQSPSVPEMHSSFVSEDYIDEEMSKTFAMLSGMGIDNTEMLDDSYLESNAYLSSPNIQSGYGLSEAENFIASQSQHSPAHGSDASFYSTANQIEPQIKEESVVQDSSISNELSGQAVGTLESSNDESKDDENAEDKSDESLVLAEAEEDVGEDDEEDDAEEDDDIVGTEEETFIKDAVHGQSEHELQSSMSLTQKEQEASKIQENIFISSEDIQKSSETGIRDAEVIDSSSPLNDKTDTLSNEPLSSSISTTELKISEDILILQSTPASNTAESTRGSANSSFTQSVHVETVDSVSNIITNPVIDQSSINEENNEVVTEAYQDKQILSDGSRKTDGSISENNNKELVTPKIKDFISESEQNSDLSNILNAVDIDGISEDLTTYQVRNLKGEFGTAEENQSDSDGSNEENSTQSDSEPYSAFENWLYAIKSMVDSIMSWIPDPLYSALMELQEKGISPRVPVFTIICGFTCIFLIVPVLYIKGISKESKLSVQLASVEKKAYTLEATKTVLEEKLESVQAELAALQASLVEKKSMSENLKMECENQEEELEKAKGEIECLTQVIDSLKEKENEYLTKILDQEKEIERYAEHKEALDKIMKDQDNSISDLSDQLQESENKLKEQEKEKAQFMQLKEDYEEKLAQFEKNCSQLLEEAEVWNLRVQELSADLEKERVEKQEIALAMKTKDEEIESLKELVETFKVIDQIEDPEEQAKTKEEKLQSLMNSLAIVNQLKQEEEKSKLLDDQLEKEKSKILEMEVELLEARSEIDNLKLSYNQALQDKAGAQTKLDVLTNYFKDKEIQLQKQLGVQEAVRQKKEEDATSAERRICLIEQENASYKYQVASMKQEMEETERNLKSQIATQEKKAHENWIAARAAERKLEDTKQEITQLRQRLTLLEREQENWANAPRDEILRPVPKRMPGVNDESSNHDLNTSERGMFPPNPHDRMPMPPPPMMLPPDRPLPPLPPPPMFLPPMEMHFRSQPWHRPPPEHRTTPPEFMAGRELTPPRGRPSAVVDGDVGPHASSSPLTTDTRDSRNSTPPHLLPDFHDVPPQPGMPFFPPPPPHFHPRMPMHPPFRRDMGPVHKRSDHSNNSSSRGNQQPPPQEHWQHSRV